MAVRVTHADFLPPGDSSIWDKGSDESQLLVERCRQPHGFHQNQNQRPQWGPVHHPPCRSGGHIRCASKPLGIFTIYSTFIVIPSVLLCVRSAFFCSVLIFCSAWYILLHRDAWLWYAAVTRYGVLQKRLHPAVFLQQSFTGFVFSLSLRSLFQLLILQIVQNCWTCTF